VLTAQCGSEESPLPRSRSLTLLITTFITLSFVPLTFASFCFLLSFVSSSSCEHCRFGEEGKPGGILLFEVITSCLEVMFVISFKGCSQAGILHYDSFTYNFPIELDPSRWLLEHHGKNTSHEFGATTNEAAINIHRPECAWTQFSYLQDGCPAMPLLGLMEGQAPK
ncbi:hypothetical protein STEG23_015933, partial [Scotinomys teguina]